MTKQELNKDIKRLYQRWQEAKSTDAWYSQESILQEELERLWNADRDKTRTNYDNFKRLLIMNQSMRAIPLPHIATYLADRIA